MIIKDKDLTKLNDLIKNADVIDVKMSDNTFKVIASDETIDRD